VQAVAAEGSEHDGWRVLLEREEITRLGRGVDQRGSLAAEAIEETVAAVRRFVDDARALGVRDFTVVATSAARDAVNGAALVEAVQHQTGLPLQILSGEREGELTFLAVSAEAEGAGSLGLIDIGGGSTEVVTGGATRHSLQIGTVRVTERCAFSHPLTPAQRGDAEARVREAFAGTRPGAAERWVAAAATATTLASLVHGRPFVPRDRLRREALAPCVDRLCGATLEELRALPGVPLRRADLLPAGGLILLGAMEAMALAEVLVTDRGLRWGVLRHAFGG
jgi:exopolyphosphatase / guanosine-5'-triphosphate,3'-diphosphate pyrophosphatase